MKLKVFRTSVLKNYRKPRALTVALLACFCVWGITSRLIAEEGVFDIPGNRTEFPKEVLEQGEVLIRRPFSIGVLSDFRLPKVVHVLNSREDFEISIEIQWFAKGAGRYMDRRYANPEIAAVVCLEANGPVEKLPAAYREDCFPHMMEIPFGRPQDAETEIKNTGGMYTWSHGDISIHVLVKSIQLASDTVNGERVYFCKHCSGDVLVIKKAKGEKPSSGTAPSVAERLKQLKELKDQGIITEEEYKAKRKNLVDQL